MVIGGLSNGPTSVLIGQVVLNMSATATGIDQRSTDYINRCSSGNRPVYYVALILVDLVRASVEYWPMFGQTSTEDLPMSVAHHQPTMVPDSTDYGQCSPIHRLILNNATGG